MASQMPGGKGPGGRKLQGLSVLLVDDNRDSATSMARLLGAFGCETAACFTGTSALDRAGKLKPQVIILDLRLPDVPGTEVCRRLRASPALTATTMVALTGATDERTLEQAREAGFDHLLAKPVGLDDLLALLENVQVPGAGR